MSARPKRERRAPERLTYGRPAEELEDASDDAEQQEEEQEQQEEEERPAKRSRRAGKEPVQPESESDDESAASDDEMAAAEAAAAGPSRRGGGRKQAAAAAPAGPPMSRADLLAALHACPTLVDHIIQPDGLRTPTLLARDVANLAVALCASAADMADAWRALALQQEPDFAGTSEQALAAAKAAVAADPARLQRCTKTNAKADYRLSDKDLEGLSFLQRHNPIFWHAAPTKLYSVLDCLAIAHRKYGDLAGIEAAKAKGKERGAKMKASKASKQQDRKGEIEEALKAAGLNVQRYSYSTEAQQFIKNGRSTAAQVAASLKKEEERERKCSARREQLLKKLTAAGLASEVRQAEASAYILGFGELGLAAVVRKLKQDKEQRDAEAARTEELLTALAEAEVEPALDTGSIAQSLRYPWGHSVPEINAYIKEGKGSPAAVVEAVKKEAAASAAKQQEHAAAAAAREERRARLAALLAEAGVDIGNLAYTYALPAAVLAFIGRGEGTEQEALAAAQQEQAERQAREAAREERRAAVLARLQAEGLEEFQHCSAAWSYVQHNMGSLEEVLAAARGERDQRASTEGVHQRRAAMYQLLVNNGMPSSYCSMLAGIAYYIETGNGSEAAALAEAKKHHAKVDKWGVGAAAVLAAGGGGGADAAAAGGGGALEAAAEEDE